MSKIEYLRVFLNQKLITAAEEIFGVVEETIAEYQEEVSHTKEENRRLRSMLDIRSKPQINYVSSQLLRFLSLSPDLQHLPVAVSDEVVSPEQQEWGPSLGQKDPESTRMKDEQDEPRTSQEDENNFNEFINSYGCVSSGYYQDPTQSSHGERYSLPNYGPLSGLTLKPLKSKRTKTSTESMVEHLQTHIGAKCCHICGKYFAWDTFLKRHLRSHTGEKPFHCQDCGKGFTQRGHLNLHMRSHTGEKPHQCQDCGKGFSQSGNLAVHMKSHSGEKPHRCPVCGKCFSRNPDLTVHIRTHTGVKPYKCQYCGQGFKQNYNLKLHMKIHMGKTIS
uniref:C2H2-type domain-containing protein n=1 Tax=Hucho hucho TaxID=62062 RepID=A0A4W5QTS9_9TELE